jgi:hypothetical protein
VVVALCSVLVAACGRGGSAGEDRDAGTDDVVTIEHRYGTTEVVDPFVSALSLPFLLDELVPMLAAAVDGDPATR